MSRSLLALLFLLFVHLPSAAAQTVVDRAQCRLSFGNSVRSRATFTGIRVEICQRQRLLGKIDAGIDCNDPSTWELSGYAEGVKAMARSLSRFTAESAVCSPGVTATSEVGYGSCPAPCAGLPTSTFPELGVCLECVVQATALPVFQTTLGVPPLPAAKVVRKCQEAIGRGIVRYLNKRMVLQHGCQFLKEVAKPGWEGVDCTDLDQPTHPYVLRSQRGRAKLQGQIARRCGTVALGVDLDTCGTDAVTEAACVLAVVDAWSNTLHTALYPPF